MFNSTDIVLFLSNEAIANLRDRPQGQLCHCGRRVKDMSKKMSKTRPSTMREKEKKIYCSRIKWDGWEILILTLKLENWSQKRFLHKKAIFQLNIFRAQNEFKNDSVLRFWQKKLALVFWLTELLFCWHFVQQYILVICGRGLGLIGWISDQ